ncbi:MAG: tail fiber protein [Pseudomonadota bacterium]
MKKFACIAAACAVLTGATSTPAAAQTTPFIGQITMVGMPWCPRGWATTSGQLLPISSNEALFSLIGTIYGGDGRTTFGLPDLRGRFAIHNGTGPGLSPVSIGQKSGRETVALTQNELPAHTHTATGTVQATSNTATAISPAGALNAQTATGPAYATLPPGQPAVAMAADSVAVTVNSAGSGAGFNIRNPYQAVTYCIALQGTFPSRN